MKRLRGFVLEERSGRSLSSIVISNEGSVGIKDPNDIRSRGSEQAACTSLRCRARGDGSALGSTATTVENLFSRVIDGQKRRLGI